MKRLNVGKLQNLINQLTKLNLLLENAFFFCEINFIKCCGISYLFLYQQK